MIWPTRHRHATRGGNCLPYRVRGETCTVTTRLTLDRQSGLAGRWRPTCGDMLGYSRGVLTPYVRRSGQAGAGNHDRTVAHHQPVAVRVKLVGVCLDVGAELPLQRRGQPPRVPSRTISSSNDELRDSVLSLGTEARELP
jgi:hypothetical protein